MPVTFGHTLHIVLALITSSTTTTDPFGLPEQAVYTWDVPVYLYHLGIAPSKALPTASISLPSSRIGKTARLSFTSYNISALCKSQRSIKAVNNLCCFEGYITYSGISIRGIVGHGSV